MPGSRRHIAHFRAKSPVIQFQSGDFHAGDGFEVAETGWNGRASEAALLTAAFQLSICVTSRRSCSLHDWELPDVSGQRSLYECRDDPRRHERQRRQESHMVLDLVVPSGDRERNCSFVISA